MGKLLFFIALGLVALAVGPLFFIWGINTLIAALMAGAPAGAPAGAFVPYIAFSFKTWLAVILAVGLPIFFSAVIG